MPHGGLHAGGFFGREAQFGARSFRQRDCIKLFILRIHYIRRAIKDGRPIRGMTVLHGKGVRMLIFVVDLLYSRDLSNELF